MIGTKPCNNFFEGEFLPYFNLYLGPTIGITSRKWVIFWGDNSLKGYKMDCGLWNLNFFLHPNPHHYMW